MSEVRAGVGNYHRDMSPSQRVAALTDAIDDEVLREIGVPPLDEAPTAAPASPSAAAAPLHLPPVVPSTYTSPGLGPSNTAPLTLPDDGGIMVFVPEMPIEELALGEEAKAHEVVISPTALAPVRHKIPGGTTELAPITRRPRVASGHGVATRTRSGARPGAAPGAALTKSGGRLWIALLVGSLVLIAIVVGAVLFFRR